MLTADQAVKMGVPPALKDRYIVKIIDAKFGLSKSSGNPMVTLTTEIAGVPMRDGSYSDKVRRGDTTYQVAGLQLQPNYFPLVAGKALGRFIEFLKVCELPFDQIDDENHDCSVYKGLTLEAIVSSSEEIQRMVLTPEDKEAGKKEGDPILGDDGKPLTRSTAFVTDWIKRYTGELPPY